MKNKNILLHQFIDDNIVEFIPDIEESKTTKYLSNKEGKISWIELDSSLNIIINNKFKDTNIFYSDDGRIGINRFPLHNYKIDIAVPKDTLLTALHIGDGSYGFSMGNGTIDGFIPEIIGLGAGKFDAGLYFVGIAGSNEPSDIPLVIVDGRSMFNTSLTNRPIFGITSAKYTDYKLLLTQDGDLKISGDIILENKSLKSIINRLEQDIQELKTKIT